MGWNVQHKEHFEFERHALKAVVAQLKFHPVLKVQDTVAAFQDHVRSILPVYETGTVREVRLDGATGALSSAETQQHIFKDTESTILVALTPTAVSVEARRHSNHAEFLRYYSRAIEALLVACGEVSPTRLGLRYINLFEKKTIEKDLNEEPIKWADLIDSKFLNIPHGLVDLKNTSFHNRVHSAVDGGKMTLTYGIDLSPDGEAFRLDLDRFTDTEVVTADSAAMIKSFHDDIYALFNEAVTEKLRTWMRPISKATK